MDQATPKSDTFAVLSCCNEVELVDLGHREMHKKKIKANHGLTSIPATHTDKVMDINRLLLRNILGLSDSKILYLFIYAAKTGRQKAFVSVC